ncbi:MAG: L-glutamate gamma-semialdehyde dehydrogenase [Spirochaetes bacterium]|nr:L-glutamate gamma-semialdehyde dehydrogenase [Spirochaetota bacterium]
MNNGICAVPARRNLPNEHYLAGSPERLKLEAELERMAANPVEIPVVAGGKEIFTGRVKEIRAPHDHSLVLGRYHEAGPAELDLALQAGRSVARDWAALPWEERAAVFMKAAALIEQGYKYRLNAATMLGQSKNIYQAEIDAACESADFYSNNPYFASQIYRRQSESTSAELNRLEYRPLEGFVYAVTPFNFTAIAANLPSAPALMGNVVMWKPASSSVLSNWHLMQLYRLAGLPDGVINFLPGRASEITTHLLGQPDFAGLHFTGSTGVFNSLWKGIAGNLENYRTYPRIVGETGGKDFVFVHPDADFASAIPAIVRGAFEYQGQKCSASSRLYLPRSRSQELLDALVAETKKLKVGSPLEPGNFVNAVIDKAAFASIKGYIEKARSEAGCHILAGGKCDDSRGWFIEPTIILADKPDATTMVEEIFGPVLTVYCYDDSDLDAAYKLVDATSPYALTGAIFARERREIVRALNALANAAGNFYINDKPSGAVVGRQPFGGARGSGTNDKAGSELNLLRWISARNIKENFTQLDSWAYGYM